MIDELHVTDVALIRDATLTPVPGLTAITGETGAGKSALLSALKLLIGERADAGSVREGSDALVVEGRFYSDDDPDGHVVRRRVGADGRGRVSIDGSMASVRELASGLGATVDLCGQHEHQRLLAVGTHVEILDAWAGARVAQARAAWGEALSRAREAARELERVTELASQSAERLDEASFVLQRIDAVNPSVQDYEQLERDLPRAEHGEALLRSVAGAAAALGEDGGATDALGEALSELEGALRYDSELRPLSEQIRSALIDIEDAASELRSYASRLDLDEDELIRMQERMGAYQGLLRSYGPGIEDLLARRAQAAEIVALSQDSGVHLRKARRAAEAAEKALSAAADELDAARAEAAPLFSQAVTRQMERLEMGSARLEVASERLPRSQWVATGPSHVEFLYRPGAGMAARPLRRIASGGEVSRVMLACKVVQGASDAVSTLVFDEVDAGVGGATALALAAVLADLATTHQVIVVTHLAQVAVQAQCHYLVSKSAGELPETQLREVTGEERVAELARMLSGDTSETSLAHAREMLASVSA